MTGTSVRAKSPALVSPKTFKAPITCVRSRSGNACTDWKPAAAVARGANRGHRSLASARSTLMTGTPVRKASWQRPRFAAIEGHEVTAGHREDVAPPVLAQVGAGMR